MIAVLLGVLCLGATTTAPSEDVAQPLGNAPVLLIMDASGSMNADDGSGQPKIEAARQALTTLIDGLPEEATVGLRAYGHRTPNTDREAGCADTELLVPVGTGNRDQLRAAVSGLQASGFTPIGSSLRAALEDLPPDELRTVVLVSDGIDTCAPPAACEVARQIVAEGVQLRVETVGFQVDAAAAAELQCIAEVTGGTYRPADDAEDLARELRANIPSGTPIEGGPTPAEAVVITPGQYVDVLAYPQQRWYAVRLRPGDRVRATAAIIGGSDTPDIPSARVEMVLGYGDVIGVTACDTDAATGIGPFTQNLAVDGLEVAGGTVCADEGTYVIGLSMPQPEDRDARRAVEGLELPIELFVAVTSDPVAPEAEPVVQRPQLDQPPPVDPGRRPTPSSYYLFPVAAFGTVGVLGGWLISRRMGP
ncbi:MAG TPA: VWA domain-containing protein [Euzebya sp.]|nr:VWA domain-containing protein [Euzebya sp.]